MKALLLIIVACLYLNVSATPWTDRIEDMWRQGKYHEGKEIAAARLSDSPDDVASLILALDYDVEYLKLEDIPATIDRLISAGAEVRSPQFLQLYPRFVVQLTAVRKAVRDYTAATIDEDRKKSGLTGKKLPFAEELRALEQDGQIH